MGIQTLGGFIKQYITPEWLGVFNVLNDGSDGTYSPVSTASLTSDVYRFSSLNIPAGVTITPTGAYLVIIVNGTANIDGLLSASGKGAAGSVGSSWGSGNSGNGGGGTTGYTTGLPVGGGGAGGGTGASGQAGGNGGIGSNGGVSGGNGAGGSPDATIKVPLNNNWKDIAVLKYSIGGGGGAGGYNNAGLNANITNGSGGVGGGTIILIANRITGTGAVRADGINGTSASSGATTGSGWAGGGGGGGGGAVHLISYNKLGIPLTISASGGTGGAGFTLGAGGTGNAGGAGSLGMAVQISLS